MNITMKTRKMRLVLAALLFASLAWGDDPCPCPGETPYAGTDACGNDVCGSNDVDTYPYMDACGNGVCDPDLDGEYPDTAYDCDGDGELDSCDECLEISGSEYLLKDGGSLSYSTADSETEWEITSGSSYASLSSTTGASVDLTGTQVGVVTLEASRSQSNVDTIQIQVFSVAIVSDSGSVGDGATLGVDITTHPQSVEDEISAVQMKATKPDGTENFNNLDNAGTSLSKVSELEWSIDNARWYAGPEDCYKLNNKHEAPYVFEIDFKVASYSFAYSGGDVKVNAGPNYVNGSAYIVGGEHGWYDGELSTSFSLDPTSPPEDELWEWKAYGQGSFRRDIKASIDMSSTHQNSQFYNMVRKEELFHEKQLEGTVSSAIDPSIHWSADVVASRIVGSIITGPKQWVETESTNFVNDEISDHYSDTWLAFAAYSFGNITTLRKEIECQAKDHAGSQFHFEMICAYGVSCN